MKSIDTSTKQQVETNRVSENERQGNLEDRVESIEKFTMGQIAGELQATQPELMVKNLVPANESAESHDAGQQGLSRRYTHVAPENGGLLYEGLSAGHADERRRLAYFSSWERWFRDRGRREEEGWLQSTADERRRAARSCFLTP